MPLRAAIRDERVATLLCLLLAIAVTAVAWGGVPWGTFQFDDLRNVVHDPATTDAAAFLDRLPQGLRPLTRLSYFVDAQLHGLNAAGFLATNLLLHATTVLLVFALARRRLGNAGALMATVLFSVQPANAEVVAYVSGRSTGLMTPLLLAGLLMHDKGNRPAALTLFLLACLAKEHALVFPALVFAWELTRAEKKPGAIRDVGACFAAGGVILAALLGIERYRSLIGNGFADRPLVENVLANARAIPEMLSLWVRPWALSVDHAFDGRVNPEASVVGLVFLAAAAAGAIALRRRQPHVALAVAWALISLLPTNSILAKADLVTEKPLYLAWVGPAIALGAGIPALLDAARARVAKRVLVMATAVVVLAFIGASAWRASLWRDPVALWSDAVAKAPYRSRSWNNLGMANLAAGRHAEALVAFQRAVFLDPRNDYAAMNVFTARALCGDDCEIR